MKMKKFLVFAALVAALALSACSNEPRQPVAVQPPARAVNLPEVNIRVQQDGNVSVAVLWFDGNLTSVKVAGQEFKVVKPAATSNKLKVTWEDFKNEASQVTKIYVDGKSVDVKEVQVGTGSLRIILSDQP